MEPIAADSASSAPVLCVQCKACVGILDSSSRGYKLRKACLSVATGGTKASSSYSQDQWLSSILLTAAESQGVRRLVVYAGGENGSKIEHVMHVWLFAPDLRISSSVAKAATPMRVAKVLHRAGLPADVEKLGGVGAVEGEVELSKNEWCELQDLLTESAKLLPEAARRFQHWTVGLLRRFTTDDLHSHTTS